MQSKYHLSVQVEMHRENVKKEEKMSKKNKKFVTEERVKQPKQKQTTNNMKVIEHDTIFTYFVMEDHIRDATAICV